MQKNFSDILESTSEVVIFCIARIELRILSAQNELIKQPHTIIREVETKKRANPMRGGGLVSLNDKVDAGYWNEKKNDVFGDNRNHTTFYTYNYGDTLQISLLIVSGPTLRLKSINSNYTFQAKW